MLCIKRILIIPLSAVLLATLLAVAPTGGPNVAVLSTLEAEPADAHTATKQETRWRNACRWEPQQVQVVVGYKYPNRRGPRLLWGPIYAWKQELVKVCEREYYTVTKNKSHFHVSDEVCNTVRVFVAGASGAAGGFVGGTAGSVVPGAGTVGGAAIGGGTGGVAGYWVSKPVCKLIPDIIWLDWL